MTPRQIRLQDILNFEEYATAGLDVTQCEDTVDRRTLAIYTSCAAPRCNGDDRAADVSLVPGWLDAFDAAFDAHQPGEAATHAPREAALSDVFSALVTPVVRDIQDRLEAASFDTDMDALVGDIGDALYSKLFSMCARALVVELAAAQSTGLLKGETSKDRFWYFASCLRNPDFARVILLQYPLLVRQATIAVGHWRAALIEFADRLVADADEIARVLFDTGAPGRLTGLGLSAGDSHRQGRSVIIAEFNGGEHTVVYKPRSLAVDRCFTNLVSWMTDHGHQPTLSTVPVLEKDGYGWAGHIAAGPCADESEIRTFYRRQGANIALLYFLKGTDLHSENIIAAGDSPVMVDLEALFHPAFQTGDDDTATTMAQRMIERSAVATGILPVRAPRATSDDEWLDMSGMSGAEDRHIPFDLPMWVDFDSDDMRMQFERTTLDADNNLPVLNGQRIGPKAYTKEIVQGFTEVYELVCAHRNALLAPNGPLATFAQVEVRVIVRNTARYEQILHDSYHPDFLSRSSAREAYFDSLWEEEDARPYLKRLHRAERHDLWNCDVPVFTTQPSSTRLWTSTGEEIENAFAKSSMAEVVARVEAAGPRDLAMQTFMIRASLAEPEHGIASWVLPGQDVAAPAENAPLDLAKQIGEHLLATAIRHDGGASWIILEETDGGNASTAPAGGDLYSGLPGIAMFLECLGRTTNDTRFTAMADEALTELNRLLPVEQNANLGAFTGAAGVVYALSQADGWLNGAGARHAIEQLYGADRLAGMEDTDVIAGLAGSVLAMLAAEANTDDTQLFNHAVEAGEVLVLRLGNATDGCTPFTPDELAASLGLGHGRIGAALALARLGARSGENRFTASAKALAAREIVRMDEAVRVGAETGIDLARSWCNGTSGFLLAMLEIIELVPEAGGRETISRLLEPMLDDPGDATDCLCHGSLGSALIVEKATSLGLVEDAAAAERLRAHTVARIAESGIASGTVSGLHAPGLMDGLSGVGLGLLKLHATDAAPDVLTLS